MFIQTQQQKILIPSMQELHTRRAVPWCICPNAYGGFVVDLQTRSSRTKTWMLFFFLRYVI